MREKRGKEKTGSGEGLFTKGWQLARPAKGSVLQWILIIGSPFIVASVIYAKRHIYESLPPQADIAGADLKMGVSGGNAERNLCLEMVVRGQNLTLTKNSLAVYLRFCLGDEKSERIYFDLIDLRESHSNGTWYLVALGQYSERQWKGRLSADLSRMGGTYEITVCQAGKRIASRSNACLPPESTLMDCASWYCLQIYAGRTPSEAGFRKEVADAEYGVACDILEVTFPDGRNGETENQTEPHGTWFRVCVAQRFSSRQEAEDFHKKTFGGKRTFADHLIHPMFSEFGNALALHKNGEFYGKVGGNPSGQVVSGSRESLHRVSGGG